MIHAHGLRAATVAAAANTGRPTPLVVTLHNQPTTANGVIGRSFPHSNAMSRGRRSRDRRVARPRRARSRLRSAARHVRPGRRPAAAATGSYRAEIAPSTGVPEELPVLLSVGRLHPQKGYDTLLTRIADWRGRAVSLIAGDGPLEDELRQRIAREGLPVQLLGRRADVADLLQAADMVVLPSAWEARSLVAQEAMQAGVPLICTTRRDGRIGRRRRRCRRRGTPGNSRAPSSAAGRPGRAGPDRRGGTGTRRDLAGRGRRRRDPADSLPGTGRRPHPEVTRLHRYFPRMRWLPALNSPMRWRTARLRCTSGQFPTASGR